MRQLTLFIEEVRQSAAATHEIGELGGCYTFLFSHETNRCLRRGQIRLRLVVGLVGRDEKRKKLEAILLWRPLGGLETITDGS
jgi:hypothetical protein